MLDKKILEKIIHFSTANEVEENMNLNVAAEFLDDLDNELKEKIFIKDREDKQSEKWGGVNWLLTKAQPIYKYGFASVMAGLVALMLFNKEPNDPFSLQKGFNAVQLSKQTISILKKEYKQSKKIKILQRKVDRVIERILHAANMNDVSIAAHVISTGEPGAWVLPENNIVISSEMVSLCNSEDELAVVLSHEVAHIKKGHINNPFLDEKLNIQYRGYLGQLDKSVSNHLVNEYANLFIGNEKNIRDEIESDREGIMLTVLAGYDPNSIYSVFDKALSSQPNSNKYPPKTVRLNLMESRLGDMVDDAELYYSGILYYLKGDLNRSEELFNTYKSKFPGREVYNNLGVIQYHRALYRLPMSTVSGIRPIAMDFNSLTDKIVLRGNSSDDYLEYLNEAKINFEKAISLDNDYAIAHFNLANIYLDLGNILGSVNHLDKARELDFDNKKCDIMESSIAIQQKNYKKAKAILSTLTKSPEVYFNRGLIALNSGLDFKRYFSQFLEMSSNIHPVYIEFAQSKTNISLSTQKSDPIPQCNVIENLYPGDSKNKIQGSLGRAETSLNLVKGLSLWNYPEKFIKIYFEKDRAKFIVHTNPAECIDANNKFEKENLHLNPDLRNYHTFDNGFIAGDESGISLYGTFSD